MADDILRKEEKASAGVYMYAETGRGEEQVWGDVGYAFWKCSWSDETMAIVADLNWSLN